MAAPNGEPKVFYVIAHTHWDREWYQPFQVFRLQLVRMLDELLDLLAREPRFAHFHLDGQTVVLEDYLEVRPEREAELRAQVQAGRIAIGPWYVLPDEFLVSGEALVRNLLRGRAVAERFGPPTPVGYLPDPFGHIAQLPQILRGFGIPYAAVWRGVPASVGASEFRWRAPDGSEVLTYHLPAGYFNGASLPLDRAALAERLALARERLEPCATTPYLVLWNGFDHFPAQADLPAVLETLAELAGDDAVEHGSVAGLFAALAARVEPERLPVLEGELRDPTLAHLLPGVFSTRLWTKRANAAAQELLEGWAEPFVAWASLAGPEPAPALERRRAALQLAWKYLLQNHPHDSICNCGVDAVDEDTRRRYAWVGQIGETLVEEALAELASQADTRPRAAPRPGERGPQAAPGPLGVPERLTPIVVFNPTGWPRTDSATVRVSLPAAEPWLVRTADGRAVPAQVLRTFPPPPFGVDARRRHLLDALRALADPGGALPASARPSFARLLLDCAGATDPALGVTRVAVRPGRRADTLEVWLEARSDAPHDGAALEDAWAALASAGQQAHIQRYAFHLERPDRVDAEIELVAPDVPAFGFTTLHLVASPPGPSSRSCGSWCAGGEGHPGEDAAPAVLRAAERPPSVENEFFRVEQRSRRFRCLPVWPPSVENEFFRVEADPEDGTLVLTDRTLGWTLRGLNRFVDGGDAGDEYNYDRPEEDRIVAAPAEPPRLSVRRAATRQTLRIEQRYRVPARLGADRRRRSDALVDLPITSQVTLRPGVRRVEIETEFDNRAEDHRLRVHFPTGLRVPTVHVEQQFAVLARPVAPPGHPSATSVALGTQPPPAPLAFEDPAPTAPQQRFVDVSDGQRGLLVANLGLPEYEPLAGPEGVEIALTLLRSVGWLSRDDLATRRGGAGPVLETPGAQGIGWQVARYALIPHPGGWEQALGHPNATGVALRTPLAEAHAFTRPLRALVATLHDGPLGPERSLVAVEPPGLVISAVKLPERGEGLIVRCYNPTPGPLRARLRLGRPFREARAASLAEEPGALLAEDGDALEVPVGPAQIVTLRLTFAPSGATRAP